MVVTNRATTPYRALSTLPKAMAARTMTAKSGKSTRVPMGSQANFSFSSRAIRSVPPVVAPLANTSPMPRPSRAPPKMAASMVSVGGKR